MGRRINMERNLLWVEPVDRSATSTIMITLSIPVKLEPDPSSHKIQSIYATFHLRIHCFSHSLSLNLSKTLNPDSSLLLTIELLLFLWTQQCKLQQIFIVSCDLNGLEDDEPRFIQLSSHGTGRVAG